MVVGGLATEVAVVFGLVLLALALFVTELLPNDVTAIGLVAALVVLEPWTGVDARAGISGFANPATVTIIAMYILSAGIQQTGLVRRLGDYLLVLTRGDETRALGATIGTAGPLAGIVNNTPVVAVFVPMITTLAEESGISPSKLLLPLSYAAILGGTLTLIGTAGNILASDLARLLITGRDGIGMFEFTPLGVVVLLVGLAYLMTVGRWLTPERIPGGAGLVEQFDLADHLSMVQVTADSPLVGDRIDAFEADSTEGIRILQIRRGEEVHTAPHSAEEIRADDTLVVHGTLQAVNRFRETAGVRQLLRETVSEDTFEETPSGHTLAKAVVAEGSAYADQRLGDLALRQFLHTTVLAIRREGELVRADLDDVTIQTGDLLLIRTTPEAIQYFRDTGELLVAHGPAYDHTARPGGERLTPLAPQAPVAVAIMVGVVGLAALDLLPIVIAAITGVFAMFVTGCLRPGDAYDAVSWDVVFLLAGVIPLGLALEASGGAAVLAEGLVALAGVVPLLVVALALYVLTGLLASVITPVATVVLMIPVAVDAADSLAANPFAFLLVVMFAAATSFLTPVGYQTNLMVYGPGGYRFTDFLRVGGPLQALLAVVTTIGIALRWGLT